MAVFPHKYKKAAVIAVILAFSVIFTGGNAIGYTADDPYFSGEGIKEIQENFKNLGYYNGPIDGVYKGYVEPVSQPLGKPKPGEVKIRINVEKKRLTLFWQGKPLKEYPVAVGKPSTPSPIGIWKIKRKAKNWGSGFGTRWMELNVPWGVYGIHGTNKPWSIGGEKSHGCFRMFNRNVEEIFEWVHVGTIVEVVGEVYPPEYEYRRIVHRGHKGSDVFLIQKCLKEHGFYNGVIDGIFGYGTERALKEFQKVYNYEITGQVTEDIWGALGL